MFLDSIDGHGGKAKSTIASLMEEALIYLNAYSENVPQGSKYTEQDLHAFDARKALLAAISACKERA